MSSVPSIDPAQLNGHSEQSAIELIYTKAANDVLGAHMASLEQALTTTQQILTTLTNLQNAKNQLKISGRSVPSFTNSATYGSMASKVFGSPIRPSLSPSFNYAVITSYRSALSQEIGALLAELPPSQAAQIQADPQSIYNLSLKVINDISAAGSNQNWVLDNYQSSGPTFSNAGAYQSDLTNAITSGETLNDTKKEEVQRYLYIFEEYYKSAAAMLNSITQIIQEIGRNIARS